MNKKSLERALDDLISSLAANQLAEAYYKKVRDKLASLNDENSLKSFVDALIGSAKVKDLYNLELGQCALWDKMWEEAKKLRVKIGSGQNG